MSDVLIRGLTLWRPWPWAFRHAGKRVENRTWAPPGWMVGGWIALHAGQRWDREAAEEFRDGSFNDSAMACPNGRSSEHPVGVIDAVAQLTGTYDHGGLFPPPGTEADDWAFGPVVWELPMYMPLDEPVPCKGAQGLWKLPPDVLDAVLSQVSL